VCDLPFSHCPNGISGNGDNGKRQPGKCRELYLITGSLLVYHNDSTDIVGFQSVFGNVLREHGKLKFLNHSLLLQRFKRLVYGDQRLVDILHRVDRREIELLVGVHQDAAIEQFNRPAEAEGLVGCK